MKRNVLSLLMLILLSLLLTGCYQEVDPWPASVPVVPESSPTAVPTQEATVSPPATVAPTQEQVEDNFWADETPTQVPGGDAKPGFNG